ncbi:MAG TPA: hypothetical protein VGM87_23935 [Roseomonas sp.]|jgi:hypothetical protein
MAGPIARTDIDKPRIGAELVSNACAGHAARAYPSGIEDGFVAEESRRYAELIDRVEITAG